MHILVTNDDGIDSPGLWELAAAVRASGPVEVTVVAPHAEQSGASMSFPPQSEHEIYPVVPPAPAYQGLTAWALTGSPVSCVTSAVLGAVCPRPDLVISGVNPGLNTGSNVMFSGTVGAAMTGALWGIPSMAVSLFVRRNEPRAWDSAVRDAVRLLPLLYEIPTPDGQMSLVLNVNVPPRSRGLRQTILSDFFYGQFVGLGEMRPSERKGHFFNYTFDFASFPKSQDEQTDNGAVLAGYTSVTPLIPMGVATHVDLREILSRIDGVTSE